MSKTIELTINGSVKTIAMEEPTVEQQEDFIEKSIELDSNPRNALVYFKYRNNLLRKLSGLSEEEFKNLRSTDVNKMLKFVSNRFALFGDDSDFTETSSKA